MQSNDHYVFLLGGNDAEMSHIKDILQESNMTFIDKVLGWDAKASSYEDDIKQIKAKGKTPVWIELVPDISADGSIAVDHHGSRAGEPASVLQVLNLISRQPCRMDLLIAANDAGYIPAMEKAGATRKEIDDIRAKDRAAQGVTKEQESQAEIALQKAEKIGDMIVVRMPHSKCSTVTDRLYGTQDKQNILVLSSDGEVNYFGSGDVCQKLNEKFGGWSGGAGLGDPESIAYYGGYADQGEIFSYLKNQFSSMFAARPRQLNLG